MEITLYVTMWLFLTCFMQRNPLKDPVIFANLLHLKGVAQNKVFNTFIYIKDINSHFCLQSSAKEVVLF